jgi:xanthine dehydrogenase YagR molybdenum-binding subunit
MIWGIGAALTEQLIFDLRDGHPVNGDLAEYHLPVNLDCPPTEVHLLEDRDDMACLIQSKGIGDTGRGRGRRERDPQCGGHPGARLSGDA